MPSDFTILAISADFRRLEAGLVESDGDLVHVESLPVSAIPRDGYSYLDPLALYDTMTRTVRMLVERKPREARRIAGIGLIGRSPYVAPVTKDGPQAPFMIFDRPGVSCELPAKLDPRRVHEIVGLTARRCEIPNVIGQSPQRGGDAVFLTPKDFLKWMLTGQMSTDPLDAQRTFLWSLEKRDWSDELCGAFGVKKNQLPHVMPATSLAGKVTAEAARATGLPEGLPVACGMGDWGEYLGTGVFEVGDAFEHIGQTAAFYGVTDRRPPVDMRLEVRPHLAEGRFLAGRENLPGGACLEWLLHKSYLARGGEIDWPEVDEELEAIAAMSRPENVLFFPTLVGGSQIDDGAFVRLHMGDDLTSLIQGMVEGLFFNLKAVCDELRALPWTLKAVYTTGQVGFKHAPRRTRANIYGARIFAGRRPGANVVSAALVGAIACEACADLAAARGKLLNTDGGVGPVPEVQRLYGTHYDSWARMRDSLSPRRNT